MDMQPDLRPRILIVDDVPLNLEVLAASLEDEYDLQFATSGPEAIALALDDPPDLILLDMMMPGMDGRETARQLKALAPLDTIPIIFVTALDGTENEIQGLALGAADYITKPINADTARLRIANLLERCRLHQELKRSLSALRAREQHLATLFASLQDIVMTINDHGVVTTCHVPLDHPYPSPLPGDRPQDFRKVLPTAMCEELGKAFERLCHEEQSVHFDAEWPDNEALYYYHATVSRLFDSDSWALLVLHDITARRRAEEEIRRLAFFDPLTRLPNRRLLMDRLGQAVAACQRFKRYGALLFIDMDHFKEINDTLGHDMGDMLLIEVAKRLKACVRECDTVARLGGDEFIVMIEEVDTDSAAAMIKVELTGRRILELLNQPYRLGSEQRQSTPSIGATLFRDQVDSLETLLKRADLAMYQVKQAGRNALRFFDPERSSSTV